MDSQADLSLRWAHIHFVCFVMRWLTDIFYGILFFYLKTRVSMTHVSLSEGRVWGRGEGMGYIYDDNYYRGFVETHQFVDSGISKN